VKKMKKISFEKLNQIYGRGGAAMGGGSAETISQNVPGLGNVAVGPDRASITTPDGNIASVTVSTWGNETFGMSMTSSVPGTTGATACGAVIGSGVGGFDVGVGVSCNNGDSVSCDAETGECTSGGSSDAGDW
jgi:hypothetical protein